MKKILDARRLLCPIPVIRTQDTLKNLTLNDELTIVCTDPGALHDIPAWARVHGHLLLDKYEQDGEYVVVIRKAES